MLLPAISVVVELQSIIGTSELNNRDDWVDGYDDYDDDDDAVEEDEDHAEELRTTICALWLVNYE